MLNSDPKKINVAQKDTTLSKVLSSSFLLPGLLLPTILFFGAAVRLFSIEARSIWLDEVTSLEIASRSLQAITFGEGFDSHTPPFYYIVLHFMLELLPKTVSSIRLVSTLFDLLNIALLYKVARVEAGRLPYAKLLALMVSGLFAISAFPVYYGQEGRMYSFLIFLVLLTYSLSQSFTAQRFTRWHALAFIAVGSAGMYTHYYYAFFLFGLTVGLLVANASQLKRCIPWMMSCLAISLLFIPWLRVVFALMGSGGQSFRQFTALVLPYSFFRFSAGYGLMPLNQSMKSDVLASVMANLPAVAGFCLLFGIAFLLGVRSFVATHGRMSLPLLASLIAPPLLAFLISLKIPMLSERYLLVCYPFFLFLVTLGAVSLSSKRMRNSFIALLASCSLLGALAHSFNPNFQNTQWKTVVEYLVETNRSETVYVNPHYTASVPAQYAPEQYRIKEFLGPDFLQEPAGKVFWLLERGGASSVTPETLSRHRIEVLDESYYPLGNGLRVVLLQRLL